MSSDARVRYTKTAIKNSFVEILKKKPINKVTVKEICEKAEINRATFYKYYYDAYDLLDKLEKEFLTKLSENIKKSSLQNFKDTFYIIMDSLKSEFELYKALFSENGDKYFSNKILTFCYNNKLISLQKKYQKLSAIQQEWLYYYTAEGLIGIINRWISGGMSEPIDEVVSFADKLLNNFLKNF